MINFNSYVNYNIISQTYKTSYYSTCANVNNSYCDFQESYDYTFPCHHKNNHKEIYYLIKVFPPIFCIVIREEFIVKTLSSNMIFLMSLLKIHTPFNYQQLIDITVIDYVKKKKRFEVNYQLLSIKYNQRLCVNFDINEGVAVSSIKPIYTSAGWYEREVWDMFGIFFRNHNDLRRRLTDYGFKGHPLRKDFPRTGFVEVRYCDYNKRVVYEKVTLSQEYRVFSIENNW